MTHGSCLYVLKLFVCKKCFLYFVFLIFIMRPKVQLIPLDVDYQWKEQAKTRARLEELKKPRVIPIEKPLANFSFKPAVVDLPYPPQSILSASKDSPLRFKRFIGRNPFNLRTDPSRFSSFLISLSSPFSLISNSFLAENPYYNLCSLLPSTSEPKLLR